MPRRFRRLLVVALVFGASDSHAQVLSSIDRDRGRVMLREVHKDLREKYYDPTFRGFDLDARVKQAEARIDTAKSNGEVFGIIAQVVSEIDDSFTYFVPPDRAARVRYGWEMSAVGDSVYVVAVQPGSDAMKKGLRPGDRLLSLNGFEPTRDNRWKLRYLYWLLRPQPFLKVTVRDTAGQTRSLQLDAQGESTPKLIDLNTDAGINQFFADLESEFDIPGPRSAKVGDVLMIQMSNVHDTTRYLGSPFRQMKDARAVVLDLRGNGVGRVRGFEELASSFIDQKAIVALALRRDEIDTIEIAPKDEFRGRLVIIIDSRTAGAAEMFARVMQLRGRATVIGDWSAGTGHLSGGRLHFAGTGRVVPFGLSYSTADLRLSDGRTLEKQGVMPDEILLPTPADMAAGRDPVLARAVAIAGGSLDPVAAGKLFPPRWKK